MRTTLKRLIGLDNLSEEYKFERSDSTRYTSAQKIPDKNSAAAFTRAA
jgi:hypothetical protein